MGNIRINRIIGQLKGIGVMIDNKRDCEEILQQMTAVKKAINSLACELVNGEIISDSIKLNRIIKNIINL